MNSLENLNLSNNSLVNEQQGDANFPLESSSIEENNSENLSQEITVENYQQIEKLEETNEDQSDLVASTSFQMMPEIEEGIDNDEDDEDFTIEEIRNDLSIDYSNLNKLDLLEVLKKIIYEKEIETIKIEVDAIKKAYYRSRQSEINELKKHFLEKGGIEDAFELPRDPDEDYFKELLNDYKQRKAEYNQKIEIQKLANLELKKDIINKIGTLVNRDESLSRTWEDFRDLQNQWKEIGQVPQTEMQNILLLYQREVEKFYEFIKIDKELRDLDLKKNLEFKIDLCNKAENLLLETDVVAAYKKLQDYHDQWKEAGPVPNDKREEVWERFQVATKQINKNHQDYFLKIKEELENNLQKKEILCEQAEALLKEPCETIKQWEIITNKFSDLQKMWQSVGMVPKKSNAAVYEKFKQSCNTFFENKKTYFASIRDEQNINLQKKIELCIIAESLQESTDWKKTTEDFLQLQKQWKEIGSVPYKKSQEIWLRFRKACDNFFNAKQNFFANIETEYKTNLQLKLDLIKEVAEYQENENADENLAKLKEFQNRWTQIGQVAFKEKDRLYKEFKTAISALYERLNVQKNSLSLDSFKNKIKVLAETGEHNLLAREKSAITQKIKTIENNISLWENNMSFFSGKADSLLADVKKKIEQAKAEIEVLMSQKKAIDLAEREFVKKDKK